MVCTTKRAGMILWASLLVQALAILVNLRTMAGWIRSARMMEGPTRRFAMRFAQCEIVLFCFLLSNLAMTAVSIVDRPECHVSFGIFRAVTAVIAATMSGYMRNGYRRLGE